MTVAAPPDNVRALGELYSRYKALALAAGAALVLDDEAAELVHDARELSQDARELASNPPDGLESQFRACALAADELHLLLAGCRDQPGNPPLLRLRRVRTTHSRLRSEVWKVIPCEYVPCCAPGHRAQEERNKDV
jgi:hypothetical protein